jgi:hypothetical protein
MTSLGLEWYGCEGVIPALVHHVVVEVFDEHLNALVTIVQQLQQSKRHSFENWRSCMACMLDRP